jgi:hypothetical protein
MDNVDLTLGHLRASKCVRDGEVVNTGPGTLADLPVQRLVWMPLLACAGLDNDLYSRAPFAATAPPASAARLAGAYRRKSGLQMRYTYSGFYWPSAQGTSWIVTVRCNRRLRGTPTGHFNGVGFADDSGLRASVERAIEMLDQMME